MLSNQSQNVNFSYLKYNPALGGISFSKIDLLSTPNARVFSIFMEITQEIVKRNFSYKEGSLYWIITKRGLKIGRKAGSIQKYKNGNRYTVRLNGKLYLSARLIFLWHHGFMPKVVDHKDHDTLNDNIDNIRAATSSENNKNKTSRINSSSKYLGVYFYKRKNKWHSQLQNGGKRIHIGYFNTEEEAALAYNIAAKEHHKSFANLNKL